MIFQSAYLELEAGVPRMQGPTIIATQELCAEAVEDPELFLYKFRLRVEYEVLCFPFLDVVFQRLSRPVPHADQKIATLVPRAASNTQVNSAENTYSARCDFEQCARCPPAPGIEGPPSGAASTSAVFQMERFPELRFAEPYPGDLSHAALRRFKR